MKKVTALILTVVMLASLCTVMVSAAASTQAAFSISEKGVGGQKIAALFDGEAPSASDREISAPTEIQKPVTNSSGEPTSIREALIMYGTLVLDKDEDEVLEWLDRELKVDTDVQVRESGERTWVEGPLTIKENSTGDIPNFDFKATLDMSTVKDTFDDYVSTATYILNNYSAPGGDYAMSAQLDAVEVVGRFIIKIKMPAGVVIPESLVNRGNMDGFNAEAKTIFHEVGGRELNPITNELTIMVAVGGTGTDYEESATTEELKTYLGTDITFICEGVSPTDFGTYKAKCEFSGQIQIGEDIATIAWESKPMGVVDGVNHNPDGTEAPEASATIVVSRQGGGGGSSTTVKVEFIDGDSIVKTVTGRNKITVAISDTEIAEKAGYEFAGWYLDKELTQKAPDSATFTDDTKIYAKWNKIQTSHVLELEKEDHFAYIIGYPDGTVRPESLISRQEVAAIFFRLLTEESNAEIYKEVPSYSDVPKEYWSATAIASLSNGNIITGYEDGTFKPFEFITRAEFAAIAARFSPDTEKVGVKFTDVEGHWAEEYIGICAANGWITGYEDGTFKPEQYISRAEAMAIVNRMLEREADADSIKNVEDSIYKFVDNNADAWYYYIVIEATNSHDYTYAEGGKHENWTKVTEVRDWAQYEK